jgi:uncharacterized protein YcbK (DUF882 family)
MNDEIQDILTNNKINESINIEKNIIESIKLKNNKTSEKINLVYWIEGSYVTEALKEVNYFMRDWRQNKAITYDVANIDIISATQSLLDTFETMQLLSGYRTATTNKMLSYSNSGVARNSYHIKGMAADLRLDNRPVSQIAAAAKACMSGGVGSYSRSGFVHIDCGPVRSWKR